MKYMVIGLWERWIGCRMMGLIWVGFELPEMYQSDGIGWFWVVVMGEDRVVISVEY